MTDLLESCRIAPPPGTVAELTLPLTFFDLLWVHFHPIRRLLFYDFPCSKAYFLETLVPKLKESLSLTLKHYSALAGSLAYPLSTEKKPVIRCVLGDSVSLTIVESNSDFDNLVGNHARDADQFYDFIPQLPPMTEESDHKLLQVLAIQVTLFPGRGICIGIANHHAVGDASSVVGFIRSWAAICKLGGDDEYSNAQGESLPLFDRSVVKEPSGVNSVYWSHMKEIPFQSSPFPSPTNRVRATYVLGQREIKKLKDSVQARIPGIVHVSSFVVVAAYVWTCLAKSLVVGEEAKVDDEEEEFFLFAVDSRARLYPPVPGNYFGNCLSYGLVKIRRQELVGEEGFFVAAEATAREIRHRVNDKTKILAGVENWITEINSVFAKRIFSVSGSARVDLYNADFGWGAAKKLETLSIDGEQGAISLCKSRDSEGGLEVGLSLPKVKMDAFAAAFAEGIKSYKASDGVAD